MHRGPSSSLVLAMDGRIVRCGIISSELPLPRLQSASGHESDSCKQRHRKNRTLLFRRNRSCSASDSAYSYTFFRSVVCLSFVFTFMPPA